jgi:DNA topoisomerase-1
MDKKARARSPRSDAERHGLRYVTVDRLTIRRRRQGSGFCYLAPDGRVIRDPRMRQRLQRLAVPPAYEDVFYAKDPDAHIQAIGRDAAGRLQYRYHTRWQSVREAGKARRLAHLSEALPRIRRKIAKHLASDDLGRPFALCAVIDLVMRSAIRPGRESYARLNGTRGAATLLKSNIVVDGDTLRLSFRAKGGKDVCKEVRAPRLAAAIAALRQLPGRRVFQYRDARGAVRRVTAQQVNAFLREIAGAPVSLKDLRTLCASSAVLDALLRTAPAKSERTRRRQVRDAVTVVSRELANTPTICLNSYVHKSIVTAFEAGALLKASEQLKRAGACSRERLLAKVIAGDDVDPPHID